MGFLIAFFLPALFLSIKKPNGGIKTSLLQTGAGCDNVRALQKSWSAAVPQLYSVCPIPMSSKELDE